MELVYDRTQSILNVPSPYCAGCGHGLTQKLIAEVIDEMQIRERFVYASSVGCNGMGAFIANTDSFASLHGRVTASATGFKRVNPDAIVMAYQGDGDAASIGLGESIHAANRGEALTIIMANNMIFGMTGGQASPTTLAGEKTTTSVTGKDPAKMGYPLRLAEIIASLEAPAFVARCSVHNPREVRNFKKAVRHALTLQAEKGAYSFIEVLVPCPTNARMKPSDCMKYIEEHALPVFPLGVLKDTEEGRA